MTTTGDLDYDLSIGTIDPDDYVKVVEQRRKDREAVEAIESKKRRERREFRGAILGGLGVIVALAIIVGGIAGAVSYNNAQDARVRVARYEACGAQDIDPVDICLLRLDQDRGDQ